VFEREPQGRREACALALSFYLDLKGVASLLVEE